LIQVFTGLVQTTGILADRSEGRFSITCGWDPESLAIGASIACDGVCLTATKVNAEGEALRFTVDVSEETLARTTLRGWRVGRRINLERSLRAGDELGGHLVSGHVDGVAHIESLTPSGGSKIFEIRAPDELARFIASKGSVALDGVSLTVNEVAGPLFRVNLIPHTLSVTNWGERRAGDGVNMEVDLIARYVARLLGR
jgi:riboflavin synthase